MISQKEKGVKNIRSSPLGALFLQCKQQKRRILDTSFKAKKSADLFGAFDKNNFFKSN